MEVKTNVKIVKGILKKAKKENRVLNEVETSQIQKCLNEILQENLALEENMENMDQNTVKYENVIECVKDVLDSLIENPARLDFTIDAMTEVIEKMDKVGIN
ncbi:hypothetical protein [uncultured Dubosiella sp.]|uniref:hypothetical protein n=1 Tax=uncultured Dubosiella sp. TaxID=1937011 RepID=UPI0027313E87|nr:hypothetical protein [uncultured Dubosiella sp.]